MLKPKDSMPTSICKKSIVDLTTMKTKVGKANIVLIKISTKLGENLSDSIVNSLGKYKQP